MKIISLNVNGLRAFDSKNSNDFNHFCLNVLKGDIICLQEIKGSEGNLAKYSALKDYHTFSSILIKGRHGVATLVKKSLYCEKKEIIVPGRIIKTYHGNFVLYNCYMPYYDEEKDGDKSEIMKIYNLLESSVEDSRTILCGDFNAAYNILDHYQFKEELDTLIDVKKWIDQSEIHKVKKTVSDKINNKNDLKTRILKTDDLFMSTSSLEMIEKIKPKKQKSHITFLMYSI